jgi:hypothetical protein
MSARKIGVWINYHNANLIEYNIGKMGTKVIISKLSIQPEQDQPKQSAPNTPMLETVNKIDYYQQIGAVLKQYAEVLLFGPTDAKTELFEQLKTDPHFFEIKFTIKPADKMTEYQQYTFVRDHFGDQTVLK